MRAHRALKRDDVSSHGRVVQVQKVQSGALSGPLKCQSAVLCTLLNLPIVHCTRYHFATVVVRTTMRCDTWCHARTRHQRRALVM
jgi:hypothetical protein